MEIIMDMKRSIITSPFLSVPKDNEIINYLHKDYDSIEPIQINDEIYAILKTTRNSILLEKLITMFEPELIKNLLENQMLLYEDEMWTTTNYDFLEIETCTHCNHRCLYCPVAQDPKKPKVMSIDLFNTIINKAVNQKKIKAVSFNSYNEPTLDKYFYERVLRLAQTSIKLVLNTNASNLNEKMIRFLKQSNVLSSLNVNLPSIEEDIYSKMTGSSNFKQVIKNIETAIQYELPIKLSIQGTKEEKRNNIQIIIDKYKNLLEYDEYSESNDRAGLLKNQYAQNICLKKDYMYGYCLQAIRWLCFSVDGEAFICCNDYYQKTSYGNIRDYSIDEIVNNEKAQEIRKMVFGGMKAPDNFICRNCHIMRIARFYASHAREIRTIHYNSV